MDRKRDKQLLFFEKDTIDWSDLTYMDFYKKLTQLKTDNPALWNGEAGGSLKFLETGNSDQLLAYVREKDQNKVLVFMNLSDKPVVQNIEFGVQEEFEDVFGDEKVEIGEKVNVELQAWKFKIYTKK